MHMRARQFVAHSKQITYSYVPMFDKIQDHQQQKKMNCFRLLTNSHVVVFFRCGCMHSQVRIPRRLLIIRVVMLGHAMSECGPFLSVLQSIFV